MKKISILTAIFTSFLSANAIAENNDKFKSEITDGLDVVSAIATAHTTMDDAAGELGMDVYQKKIPENADVAYLYSPADMYFRAGSGMTIGALSDSGNGFDISDGYDINVGLGWNLSSYVRGEIDFMYSDIGFENSDMGLTLGEMGGTLYFDLARRWIRSGDITIRRTLVPYIGFGAGAGYYDFDTANGNNGIYFAPRVIAGISLMMTDYVGIDFSYQYKIAMGDSEISKFSFSDFLIALRVNF